MSELLGVSEEIGMIVRGSLSEGLEMRLAEGHSVEDLRAGRFVVVHGRKFRFFSMITNVTLGAASPNMLLNPPSAGQTLHRRVLDGSGAYASVELRPMLMLPCDAGADYNEENLLPVKTIPAHFSAVEQASAEDVARVFGNDTMNGFFQIGTPLEMDEVPVCLNLERFVERSNAIFGKSGTGKTFLTRLCLCGIIQQEQAVNLIFDMHSEYGRNGTTEEKGRSSVFGLKDYFNVKIETFTLDPDSSKRRGSTADFTVRIPYSQITMDDILLLQDELNLNATAAESGAMLEAEFQQHWMSRLLEMDAETIKEFCDRTGANALSLGAFKRKLNKLVTTCSGFLVPSLNTADDAVPAIMQRLENGIHVDLEFGHYTKPLQYMLVANILTRRIHEAYVKRTEEAMGDNARQPRKLVITIEEAHKFLAPALADQTIFGTIAREMRKYNVTLLIVDQRPSGIDDEVLSQVGTKLVCLLDDEKDIDAVLTGMPNAKSLRGVLASLDSKQQALIMGHALPMPVVIKTRTYDDTAFREAMNYVDPETRAIRAEKCIATDF